MKTSTVTPLPLVLNDANFLNRLRLAAADSSRIILVGHSKKRMRERNISMGQVVKCLQKGTISEPAHLTERGEWRAKVSHRNAGDNISVPVVIEEREKGDFCIVVTVMK
ncbi:DUF4258 domain-containing protein [Propionivibrio sp.]|uniref:DUF4258 domain-containing protein n=1 Tax=Propionivibrio sp. TaxID=2212460 RepID=UPI003BF1BEBF